MQRTPEQESFCDEFKKGGSGELQALAGTGKTTSAVEAMREVPDKKCYIAVFNKKNEEDMLPKLPRNANGSTWHKLGLAFIKNNGGYFKINGNKMNYLVTQETEYNPFNGDGTGEKLPKEEFAERLERMQAMIDLTQMSKNWFVNPTVNDLTMLIDFYGIASPDPVDKMTTDALKFLEKSSFSNFIDFSDMLLYPLARGMIRPFFDKFIGDESQDNTPVRNMIVAELVKKGCDAWGIGDKHQNIYTWAGASPTSMADLIKMISGKSLPLTVNFRCDKAIVKKAQELVPELQPFEGKKDGEVNYIDQEKFLENFMMGDCGIARYNKIIIPICFKLIRAGKPCTVQGKDFEEQLLKQVKSFKAKSIDDFYVALDKWRERQLKHSKSDTVLDAVEDKFETFKFFADNSDTVGEIEAMIKKIFSDAPTPMKLSTAHKSKGLQWPRVFILDSTNWTSPRAVRPWQQEAEKNLMYVGMTRAENQLNFVS